MSKKNRGQAPVAAPAAEEAVSSAVVEQELAAELEAAEESAEVAPEAPEADVSEVTSPEVPEEFPPIIEESVTEEPLDLPPEVAHKPVITEVAAMPTLEARTSRSVFTQVLSDELAEYVEMMQPGYPVSGTDMLRMQVQLSRIFDKVLNEPEVANFKDGMFEIQEFIQRHPKVFSPKYVNRGMDQVPLSAEKRRQFETLTFLLPGIYGPEGVQFYKQYAANALVNFKRDEVRNRLSGWIKYVLHLE